MSMSIKTTVGEDLYVGLQPFSNQMRDKHQIRALRLKAMKENLCGWYLTIGAYEIPLEDFCSVAEHYIGGGAFGWGKENEPPEPVNEALTYLFQMYRRKKGKWVRRKAPTR